MFRAEIYPAYKANRAEMDPDLRVQMPVIRRLFEGFRVPVLISPGFEADDVIATLARRGEERGLDVLICTADKDARQLLSEHIRIYNLRKGQLLDVEGLKAEWGVAPGQVVDLLSLVGDAVDNVPGVPGIGPKTATELLQKFGDLDTILASVGQVSGKKRQENLRDHAETARRARTLIALREDLPIDIDWDALHSDGYDAKTLKALCVECGFHRFLDEIVDPEKPAEAVWDTSKYQLIDTPESLAAFVAEFSRQPRFCLDTETTALDPLRADLVGLSFSWREGEAYYLPVRGPGREPGPRPGGDARRSPAGAHQPRGGEGRPEPQVRPARAQACRPGAGRTVHGHDGPELPARKRRAQPQPRSSSPAACSITR